MIWQEIVARWQELSLPFQVLELSFALAAFIFVPLMILVLLTSQSVPELKVLDSESQKLPDQVQTHFEESAIILLELGFEKLGMVSFPSGLFNTKSLLQYWTHTEHQTSAIVVMMYANSGIFGKFGFKEADVTITNFYVEFASRFQDGGIQATNNSDSFDVLPKKEEKEILVVDWSKDLAFLYRLHRGCVLERAIKSPLIDELEDKYRGDYLQHVQGSIQEEYEVAAEYGYLKQNPHRQRYRPTLKGAFCMTWSLLPPLRQFIQWKNRRKIKRIMRELDINEG